MSEESRCTRQASARRLPLSVAELASAAGVKPFQSLDELRGGWPEGEDIEEFRKAVRQWRSQR